MEALLAEAKAADSAALTAAVTETHSAEAEGVGHAADRAAGSETERAGNSAEGWAAEKEMGSATGLKMAMAVCLRAGLSEATATGSLDQRLLQC